MSHDLRIYESETKSLDRIISLWISFSNKFQASLFLWVKVKGLTLGNVSIGNQSDEVGEVWGGIWQEWKILEISWMSVSWMICLSPNMNTIDSVSCRLRHWDIEERKVRQQEKVNIDSDGHCRIYPVKQPNPSQRGQQVFFHHLSPYGLNLYYVSLRRFRRFGNGRFGIHKSIEYNQLYHSHCRIVISIQHHNDFRFHLASQKFQNELPISIFSLLWNCSQVSVMQRFIQLSATTCWQFSLSRHIVNQYHFAEISIEKTRKSKVRGNG